MSTLRAIGSRTVEPDRPGAPSRADNPAGATSFPEALGKAASAAEAAPTGDGDPQAEKHRTSPKEAGILSAASETLRAPPSPRVGSLISASDDKDVGSRGHTVATDESRATELDPALPGRDASDAAIPLLTADTSSRRVSLRCGLDAGRRPAPSEASGDGDRVRAPRRRSPGEADALTAALIPAGSPYVAIPATDPGAVTSAAADPASRADAADIRPGLELARDAFALPPAGRPRNGDPSLPADGLPVFAPALPAAALASADPANLPVSDVPAVGSALAAPAQADRIADAMVSASAAEPVSNDTILEPVLRGVDRDPQSDRRTAAPAIVGDGLSAAAASSAPLDVRSEPSSGAPASSPLPTELSGQLSPHVIGAAAAGGREIVLQLHPPELGDLTVRVVVSGREVSAWFASPQIPVQQAISQAIGQLQNDLGNAGYSLASAWVGADAGGANERDARSLAQQQRGGANRLRLEQAPQPSGLTPSRGVSVYV